MARDAGVYWKYFSRKHHSPTLENIVEWVAATEEVPSKQKKPAFSQLPELKAKLAAEKTAGDFEIQQKYGQIYTGKREQRAAIKRWREQRRREIKQVHDKAWVQKENRDSAIKKIKDGYYWAKIDISKADYVNLFLPLKPCITFSREQGKFVKVQHQRAKTEKEMFQDVLDAVFVEIGDETQARVEAETYLVLELGLDPLKMDLAAPATTRGVEIENFEQLAYIKYTLETVQVPETVQSKSELETQWAKEVESQIKEAKEKFLQKEWLEDLKPARLDENFTAGRTESFDIYQIMEAWIRKRCHFIPREEKEALEQVMAVGQKEFLSEKQVVMPDKDIMVIAKEHWDTDDLKAKLKKFYSAFKDLEDKYSVFFWLLTIPVTKNFILNDDLLLQPKYEVQETVLQVEIMTHVYMHPELDKIKVDEYADEFLNSWIKLQSLKGADGDLEVYTQMLLQEFQQRAIDLIRDNYNLVGSWTMVRKMTAEVARMIEKSPPTFNFHSKLGAYVPN